MKNKSIQKTDFILIGVIAGLVAVLDWIGVVGFPIGIFSVSTFYVGSAFFTAFAIWFKWRALIGIYIGLLLGALLAGTFTPFAFILALGNVIGVVIPMLVFSSKTFDRTLKHFKDYLAFVLSATFGQNVISGAYVLGGFVLFKIIPIEAFKVALFGWIIGGIAVSIVIGIPLLKFLSPYLKKSNLIR
jgi:hypothetical protein